MTVFAAPLVCLALVVTLICVAIIRSSRGPASQARREADRQRSLQRQQERFYRQQSWLFWKDIFK